MEDWSDVKKLGQSYNTENLDIPELEKQLAALHQQVKFYSSDTCNPHSEIHGLQWVGQPTLPVMQRYQQIAASFPSLELHFGQTCGYAQLITVLARL